MSNFSDTTEKFVEMRGIVEIRWRSDDPDYKEVTRDLFDEQSKGLPDWYGKKDKRSTEQVYFACNICQCDLKSVVTLRSHCRGTQHFRKALQKKKELKEGERREKEAAVVGSTSRSLSTLLDWLDSAGEHYGVSER